MTELRDINDIHNGVFATAQIHIGFDLRRLVILKTPNPMLETTDIPPRHDRAAMREGVSYLGGSRYTLQRLNPDEYAITMIPNNSDAAFKKWTRKPKPSDL